MRLCCFITLLIMLHSTIQARTEGLETPIKSRPTPRTLIADRSEQGILLSSNAPAYPFTMEISGQNITARGKERLALDVDGKIVAISIFMLHPDDRSQPLVELLKSYQAYDGKVMEQEGWLPADGSTEIFALPTQQAALCWTLHSIARNQDLVTAITRVGSAIIIVETNVADSLGRADATEVLKKIILSVKHIELPKQDAPSVMRADEEPPDEAKRASASAMLMQLLSGIPHRTLISIDRASDEDANEVGSIRLSTKELIAAALTHLRNHSDKAGEIAAIVFDGRAAHAINLVRYFPDRQLVAYWDPWGRGSFLEAGNNAANIAAQPAESRIWHVREAELEKVLYAITLELNDVMALNETLPMHAFSGFGDTLDEARKTDFFTFFHFGEPLASDGPRGTRILTFHPAGEKFHDTVALTLTVTAAGRILDAELALRRSLIDGTDKIAQASAADVFKSFVAAATAADDRPLIIDLINEVSWVMLRGSIVSASRPMPQLPKQPTKGFLVYLGREEGSQQFLTRSILRIRNIASAGGATLIITLSTTDRVSKTN